MSALTTQLFREGTTFTKDKFENLFRITSGQYEGAFRAFQGGKILWYFSNWGLFYLADKFVGTDITDRILPYIKKALDHVVLVRLDTTAYTLNNKIFIEDMVWECTTAGTSAGSSTFPASNDVDDTHTDGTAIFTARIEWFGSSQAALYDTTDDLTGLANPDSHDAYASTLFVLIDKYNTIAASTAWLAGASNNHALSYQAILDMMYEENIRSQFDVDDLVFTFQNEVRPTTGATYSFRFTLDNCENLFGLQALKSIYDDVSDATRETQTDVDIAKIVPAIVALYDGTFKHFIRAAGESGSDVSEGSLINRWEVQYAVQQHLNDDDLTSVQRADSLDYANALATGIPSWWLKKEIQVVSTGSGRNLQWSPINFELDKGGDFSIVSEAIFNMEKLYLQNPNAITLQIRDMAVLIKAKDKLVGM